LVGALDGIRRGPGVSTSSVVEVVIALALIGSGLLVFRARRSWPVWTWRRGPAILSAAVCLLGLVVVARLDQQKFDRRSYAPYDPAFAWIDAHAPSGQRVGITGVASTSGPLPVLPAFGPRLGNEVFFVGDRVRHSLHLPASQSSFDAELRRGHYGLLVVGLQNTDRTEQWAQAEGYRLATRSSRLALYVAPGLRVR